jgi:hypothetical protein
MLERDIERHVCDYAKSKGVYVRKFVSPNHSGVPDRIFCFAGRVLFVEFKAPGKKPTLLQALEIKVLAKAGMKVCVCDDKVAGRLLIDALVGGAADA